jgi:hypothetical protein
MDHAGAIHCRRQRESGAALYLPQQEIVISRAAQQSS